LEWTRVEGGRDVGLKTPLREDEQVSLLTDMEGANGEDGSHPAAIYSRGEHVGFKDGRRGRAGDNCFLGPARQLWIPSVSLHCFPFRIRRGSAVSLQRRSTHDGMRRREAGAWCTVTRHAVVGVGAGACVKVA
jgi:hypothetical protein